MQKNLARHVVIIMDGNGCWTTKRGLKQDEIVRAANKLRELNQQITLELLKKHIESSKFGPVDLLMCTGGELFFTQTLWPDFTPNDLEKIIEDYKNHDRRFGGI